MVAYSIFLVIFSLFLVTCTCDIHKRTTAFKVKDCSDDTLKNGTHELLTIPNLHINPDPVDIPGNVTVWGIFNLTETVVGNITLELTVERKLFFLWLPIPCLHNFGSCKYDVCDLLGTDLNETVECLPQLEDSDIPCECPFSPGVYRLKHEMFQIPKLKGALKSLAAGDYHVTIKLEDSGTDEVLSCQKLFLTIEDLPKPTEESKPKPDPCTGSFLECLFG